MTDGRSSALAGGLALLGASSKIAKDLAVSLMARGQGAQLQPQLQLYARDLDGMARWLAQTGLAGQCRLYGYEEYGRHEHAAVINFVGVGDPVRTASMGNTIFGVTQQYDDLVLRELERRPERRYIFLSSGAAYGSGGFQQPAGPDTPATVAFNNLQPQDYYGAAKLAAECRHRALAELAITDLRVFNYFSRSQPLEARFFITDILRAIRDGELLRTGGDYMVRDYLHPHDFRQLVECVLRAPAANQVLDCYTRAPVDKPALLEAMRQRYGLRYEMSAPAVIPPTGAKPHYYSLDRRAAKLGYQPAYTSLDGILQEADCLLEKRGQG